MLFHTPNPHGGDVYGQPLRLDFSANVNPLGTPTEVLAAVEQALPRLSHYPDPYCRSLVSAIADAESFDKILCGNGAAELIYAYCNALHLQCAAEAAPTFSEYSLAVEAAGGRVVRWMLPKPFVLDRGILDFLDKTSPQVLFLCNPNNPTGRLTAPDLLEEIIVFCRSRDIRVFLDECFLDLSGGKSMKYLLEDCPNLMILKAFTKSYAMAGLRLGYCMTADEALLEAMSRTVQPWNVSLLAQAAGVAALQQQDFLEKTQQLLSAQRQWLGAALEKCGLWVCPSDGNFLLFQGKPDLAQRLREKGIAIRDCSNYPGLEPGWFRTAVRLPEENQQLIDAIERICKEDLWQKI